jgi:hypothetical protein
MFWNSWLNLSLRSVLVNPLHHSFDSPRELLLVFNRFRVNQSWWLADPNTSSYPSPPLSTFNFIGVENREYFTILLPGDSETAIKPKLTSSK